MTMIVAWNAVAARAATVAGIKAAYGYSDGISTVKAIPDSPVDGPVAIVDYGGSAVDHGSGSTESLNHVFNIVIWTPRGNGTREAAAQLLAPMFDRFHLAFDAGVGLGGALGGAGQALITEAGPFEDADTEVGEWLTQTIVCVVSQYVSVTHAI